MVGFKHTLCVLLLIIAGVATAQNNTNSPYTRYGYGDLSDQSFGKSKAMGGVGLALRDGMQINPLNPASYTAVDSLTFLFDGGVSLQNSNMSDGITKLNAKNSSFDYVAMQFRLHKGLGFTAGVLPYSNVGYNVSQSVDASGSTPKNTKTFTGEGGLHQLFVGLGVEPVKNFSLGVNASYFWGDMTRKSAIYYPSTTTSSTYTESSYLEVRDYKLDFGAQYTQKFGKKHEVTLGVVFSPKHNLNNKAYLLTDNSTYDQTTRTTNSVTSKKDTVVTCGTPDTWGVGLVYKYDQKWTFGLDYTMQKWGSVTYMNQPNAFCDLHKIAAGAEFYPNVMSRSYFSHVKYRLGAHYSTPYYKIGGERASKEYGVSAGFGLPVPKSRSIVSITAQYVRVEGQTTNVLNENILRLSIGVTFNERWFQKWKVR